MSRPLTPQDFEARSWPDPNSGCILFDGETLWNGYQRISYEGKRWLAHRLAWVLSGRDLPAGMQLCHKCDVRSCVNIDHLFLGTAADNSRDCSRKGRQRKSGKGLPFGVAQARPGHRFKGQVRIRGVLRYLGFFDTAEQASAAALAAREESC